MRAVDHRQDPGFTRFSTDCFNRKMHCSWGAEVTEKNQFCTGSDIGPQKIKEIVGRWDWDGHWLLDIAGAGLSAHKAPGEVAGAVLVVGGQYFFTRLQAKRTCQEIDSISDIGDKRQVGRVGVQVFAQGEA